MLLAEVVNIAWITVLSTTHGAANTVREGIYTWGYTLHHVMVVNVKMLERASKLVWNEVFRCVHLCLLFTSESLEDEETLMAPCAPWQGPHQHYVFDPTLCPLEECSGILIFNVGFKKQIKLLLLFFTFYFFVKRRQTLCGHAVQVFWREFVRVSEYLLRLE